MERFWSKVAKSDGCWEWAAHRRPSGYGQFMLNRRVQQAHRVAYELTIGPIPEGLHVCHRCDNPPCCNPAHLFLGTHKQNMDDRDDKGRHRTRPLPGDESPNRKLNSDQVREILYLRTQGFGRKRLGRKFGVNPATIGLIFTGKNWKCVARATIEEVQELSATQRGGGGFGSTGK